MQVFAKAGADTGQATQPLDFLRLQLAFAIDDAVVDLQPIFVGQQLFHPVVEFEEGADQD